MRVTLIHNPEAGNEDPSSGDGLLRLIRDAGHSPRYQSSKHADWRRVLDEPTDLVAVAGGDGIVGKVAKHMVGKHIPVTLLPMGTANNIAATFDLKGRGLEQLIAGWAGARRVKFDVGVAEGPWGSTYFVEGLGVGVFTETMARLDARKNIDLSHHDATEKKIVSVLHIMRIRLEGSRSIPLKLSLDGRDLSGDYVLLEAMNIRSIGPNLRLAADADPGDGLLDVVLVPDGEREKLHQYLSDRIADKQSSPAVAVHRGQRLHIECDELRLHIDDDIWPSDGQHPPFSPMIIDVNLHSESLEVLVPGEVEPQ